jgi:hypothetical protein
MTPAPGALETLVGRLNALQAQGLIGDHAIGGAMAFVYWAEPFETKDLDVFAVLPTTAAGLIHLGRLLLDFVPATDALDEEAIAEAVSVRIGDDMTRVFTPEHAVAIALRTWRGKDREHIDRLIRTGRQPLDMARLHGILQRYALVERWRRFKEMYDVDLG